MLSNCKYLLPHRYLIMGWGFLIASGVGAISIVALDGFLSASYALIKTMHIVSWSLFYISLLFLSISREKHEDEYIMALRGRIVCGIVVCALILKIITYIASAICVYTHSLSLLGKIMYLALPTNFIVLIIAYIAIFQITLYIANRKLKSYAE